MHYCVGAHLDSVRAFAVGLGQVAGDQSLGGVRVQVSEMGHRQVGGDHNEENDHEVGGVGFVEKNDEGEDYSETHQEDLGCCSIEANA